jgi:hypothetical protein
MAFLVRGEHDRDSIRSYLLEALDFCWSVHDSGGLGWEDEPGYVQWAGWPDGVQIECSGEEFLGRAYSLDERRRLAELGFAPPEQGLPNYWRRFESPTELTVAADVLVTCLFEILTPPAPSDSRPAVNEPSSAPARVITLAPIGKVNTDIVQRLAHLVGGLLTSAGPVAIVDAHWSRGIDLPYTYEGPVDDLTGLRAPRSDDDRLVLSRWTGGDDDKAVLQRVAANVVDLTRRLHAAGWQVLLVGPLVFSHTMWAYQKVALPFTSRLLMVGVDGDWEHKKRDVEQLEQDARRHGVIEQLAAVVAHQPRQAEPLHARIAERWVVREDLKSPPEWMSRWLGLPQPEPVGGTGIDVPAVIFRVSKEWYPGIDEDRLYDVTHGWWVMGPKRERAEYAFAVAKGIVRGVYRIHGWRPRRDKYPDGRPRVRWGFDGEPADELAHLIGVDVSSYFPQGSQNPVRYLNCNEVPGSPADKAVPTPAESPVEASRSGALAADCARLQDNPVLHMSLGSKELFHSNLLGWILEGDPHRASEILSPWLKARPAQQGSLVWREAHDLDLVVHLPSWAPLVVENKVFSLPAEDQLDRYAEHNAPAAGLEQPTLLLLSLTDPGWPEGTYGPWRWVPYRTLTKRICQVLEGEPHPDPFSDELIRRWIDMVHGLERLLALVEPTTLDEPLLLAGEDVEVLRTVRLHDALQKARTRRVRHLLERRFAERGLAYDFIESAFGMGGSLLSAGVYLPDGCLVGWQLQGTQFRRFLIAPDILAGASPAQKQARIQHADDSHAGWFQFEEEQVLGPFPAAPTPAYKHFNPAFLYDYIKVPGITIQQVLDLGEMTLRSALRYREGGQ